MYLRLPDRPEDLPREFGQASLATAPYLGADPGEEEYPSWVVPMFWLVYIRYPASAT